MVINGIYFRLFLQLFVSEEIRDQELREEAGESVFCKFCDVENMADDEFLKALKALEA